jgi:hypothetical protein
MGRACGFGGFLPARASLGLFEADFLGYGLLKQEPVIGRAADRIN